MANFRVLLVGILGTLGACGGIALHAPGTGVEPSRPRGVSPAVAQSGATSPSHTKRACRTAGSEPGWVAIDYVEDSSGCPSVSNKSNAHTIAILLDYRPYRVGAELEVCAPERVPSGWQFAGWIEDSARCADDAHADDPSSKTVKLIRRIN